MNRPSPEISRRSALIVDSLIAIAIGALVIPVTFLNDYWDFSVVDAEDAAIGSNGLGGDGSSVYNLLILLTSLLEVGSLAIRRVLPRACICVMYSAIFIRMLAGIPLLVSVDWVILFGLYAVTGYGTRWAARVALIATGAGCAFMSLLLIMTYSGPSRHYRAALIAALISGAFPFVLALVAWALGLVRRARRERIIAIQERAEALEAEQSQAAQMAATAERTRIAREMHDVVAHSLSVIVAQADGGRYAYDTDPQAAPQALETISGIARSALAETRQILGVLRAQNDEDMPLTPITGRRIDELAEVVRSSGVHLDHRVQGKPRSVTASFELAAYRICQEALTNAMKHAGPTVSIELTEEWSASGLVLTIENDQVGSAPMIHSPHPGQGIIGMRERAESLGGTLEARNTEAGRFLVRALIPFKAGSAKPSRPKQTRSSND